MVQDIMIQAETKRTSRKRPLMIMKGGISSFVANRVILTHLDLSRRGFLRQLLISSALLLIVCLTPLAALAISQPPVDPFVGGVIAKLKSPTPVKEVRLKYGSLYSSWYGPGFDGRRAANGTTYHQEEMTVASRTLRFGTLLHIVNPRNGKWVIARVTDRGPYINGRDLDVSKGVARKLEMLQVGVCTLTIAKLSEETILPILYNFSPERVTQGHFNKPHRHMRQSGSLRHSTKQPTHLTSSVLPIVRTYTLYHPGSEERRVGKE